MSRLSRFLSSLLGEKRAGTKAGDELGMTSGNEQAFCRDYAREQYTGSGEIVDLGCWLGATTVSFAKGLQRNHRLTRETRRQRIHSYDLFRWHPTMEREVRGTPLAGKFHEGDSFLPEFEKRTAAWSEYFSVHAGDIKAAPWKGGPIELLFVDAISHVVLAPARREIIARTRPVAGPPPRPPAPGRKRSGCSGHCWPAAWRVLALATPRRSSRRSIR